jgi:xylose isomerase-like TIM barrel protein
LRLGTTAFSFTNEWLARRYSLEQLLRRVAELELGPAIEVIGFQAWRDYPRLGAEDVAAFRRLVDELGLEQSALGAYVDSARRADRGMTVDEAVEFLAPQIASAELLGFPLLRLHAGIPVAVLERLAPAAERAGVTLATEFQGGQTPDHPAVAAVLDCRERLDSPSVALALDFSVAMTDVPASFAAAVSRLGMRRADLDRIVERWADGASTPELHAALNEVDAPDAALDEARAGFVRFGRQDPQDWLPLVPQVAYAHAKFWELDDSGNDSTVRTAELVDVLRAGRYTGVLAAEWGGSAWADVQEVDAFELVRRHRALISKPAAVSA